MKKMNTSPISGALELLPAEQAVFTNLKNKIAEVYHRHGFLKIETPVIDRTEILFAKAGGDTEKQVYKVVKTAEAADEADQALRFDHTVPLARYVVEHESDLVFPFKATQIGRNFRGERAQKGRYREFYQCDIDIIGRNQLSLAYDAEIISTLLDAYKSFLTAKVVARTSNRKILNGLLEFLGLSHISKEIFDVVDHAEKVPAEASREALQNLGINDEAIAVILSFIEIHGPREDVIPALRDLNVTNETFSLGVNELDTTLGLVAAQGFGDNIEGDMKIVRGLDYYTGTVFEFCLPDYKGIGSVGGGGRYENLASNFTDQTFPGVGGSIGLTRLYYVLTENNLIKSQDGELIDYCLIPISENEYTFVADLAAKLREKGQTVDIIFSDKKLGDKMTYAAKLAKNGVVIGGDEVASSNLTVKNFATGEVAPLNI
ncbi:histidine--tRNA ligase [Candidatus Saccharibacteria bacterium]|nr:histidine--tRNA ligase [Candidatus Saccharibacteria bacterium]